MNNKNLTFLIQRLNHFKTLGPTIDEALKENFNVNLIIIQIQSDKIAEEMFGGILNDYNIPKFKNGTPRIQYITSINQLAKTVINLKTDIFIQHGGIDLNNQELILEHYKISSNNIVRVSVMSHFFDNCYENLEHYEAFDKCFILSKYSLEVHKEILKKSKKYSDKYIEKIIESKIEITGSALFDNFIETYNFRKKNISKKNKIIFLTPKNNHPFLSDVVRSSSKTISFLNSFFFKKGIYLLTIFKSKTIYFFLKNLYSYSNSLGLILTIKSRIKHRDGKLKKLYEDYSDEYLTGNEDRFYPDYTTAEIMQNALCVIGYQTGTTLEAVISGTPMINIEVPLKVNSTIFSQKNYVVANSFLRNSKQGYIFNYKGCVWNLKWEEANKIYSKSFIEGLKVDDEQRKKYIEYFCGIKNYKSCLVQLQIIQNLSNTNCFETVKFLRSIISLENKFIKNKNISISPFWKYDVKNKEESIYTHINLFLRRTLNINIVKIISNKDRSTISYNLNKEIEDDRFKKLFIKIDYFLEKLNLKKQNAEYIVKLINEFNKIYRNWTYDLSGSLNYNNALYLYIYIKIINPDEVLESGCYQGFSTYIIDNATDRETKIHCFDLDLSNLKFKSKKAIYYERDIIEEKVNFIGKRKLAFFDDHCDHYSRLLFSKKNNFKFCIFDDDVSYLNMHSDGSPPLPSLNMLMDENLKDVGKIKWLCNGRKGEFNFSNKLLINKEDYFYFTPDDLFLITGIRSSSITSFLIHKSL